MGEQQFLALRERLKEQIRKKMHHDETPGKSTDLCPRKSYCGSFFGPSRTVLATRLVQDNSFSFENMKSKILSFNASSAKGSHKSSKSKVAETLPRLAKIQQLKQSRDYSFLLSDGQDSMPILPTATDISTSVPLVKDKRSDRLGSQAGSKRVSVSKSNLSTKQGTKQNRIRPEGLPSKTIVSNVKNKPPAPVLRSKNDSEQKKLNLKIRIKLPVATSTPQEKKPIDKKRPCRQISDSEDEKALSTIRRMFNTQRFAGRDDSDMNMEASFQDIAKEEKRSEMFARKEDEEQLRLILEEEQRERMAKRQKKN